MSAESINNDAVKGDEEKDSSVENPDNKIKKTHKRKRKKKTAVDFAVEFFAKVILTVIAVWLICTYAAGIYVNHGNSAYPMIKDGDLCITYRLGDFREGEEIAYEHEGEIRFGRIAAMAGDVVEIENDVITVNGYNLLEDVVYPTTEKGSQITYPYTVPENSVFVLNDYRPDVSDSRSFGAILLENTNGKVVFVMRRRGI
ncbi:MAG: signal peptidase I [Eubacteriales bacterium]|nr:signal peptidase I [Eubacteriales bacterium]